MKKTTIILIAIVVLAAILRLVSLDKFPAGINADEAAIGYNAWSLINTGMDEHKNSWPLVFRSFDDYKPPLYFYLVVPFVRVIGLNIWAVRLPSAILGTLSVWILYLLVRKTVKRKTDFLALCSAFFLAISPWHLHFSRGGWEVNASTFFILVSLLFFYYSLEKTKYLFLFALFSVLSLYTYHSARLILPLLVFSVIFLNHKEFISFFRPEKIKTTLLALLLGLVLILPLVFQMLSKEGQSRFTGVSVFSDVGPYWRALALRNEHPKATLFVKVVNNQYLSYGLQFVQNYLSHFSPRFLFVVGDNIARSKVPGMGQSLISLFPFLFIGLISLLRLDDKGKKFFGLWFLLAPIAAAITFQSPHALRAENMVVPLIFIISLGVESVYNLLKKINIKAILIIVSLAFAIILGYDLSYYLHQYYVHYPKELAYAWQYGFDQISDYTKANYDKYDHIVITDRYDQPYIIMAFYLKYPPQILQNELVMTPRDKFGFSTVRNMGKYEFRTIDWGKDKMLENTLVISADESVEDQYVVDTIKDPSGKVMYKMISTAKQ